MYLLEEYISNSWEAQSFLTVDFLHDPIWLILPPAKESVDGLIDYYKFYRERDNDPVAPWIAIGLAIRNDVSFPDWLKRYLLRFENTILKWSAEGSDNHFPIQVSKELGFEHGGPFGRWRALNKNYKLFIKYEALRLDGIKTTAALDKIGGYSTKTLKQHAVY
ncbi:MAG TPA: hypothetical protein VGJ20_09545 [Xanthobacteraceae bacterium]